MSRRPGDAPTPSFPAPDPDGRRSAYERSSDRLDRAFGLYRVVTKSTVTDGGVLVEHLDIHTLNARIRAVDTTPEGAFIRQLLRVRPGADLLLRGDEALHLARALERAHAQQLRQQRIDSGRFPAAMSGAEVSKLIRRNPSLRAGRPRGDR